MISPFSQLSLRDQPNLCAACLSCIEPAKSSFEYGHSLFVYDGALRALLLKAKVQNDFRALQVVKWLFLRWAVLPSELNWCTHILPIPSSFWGRIRGQWDLPWLLSFELSKQSGKPMLQAPFYLHWRLNKRALKKNRSVTPLLFPRGDYNIRILMIDDVITSGYTINHMASSFKDATCRFLVVGDAYLRPKESITVSC